MNNTKFITVSLKAILTVSLINLRSQSESEKLGVTPCLSCRQGSWARLAADTEHWLNSAATTLPLTLFEYCGLLYEQVMDDIRKPDKFPRIYKNAQELRDRAIAEYNNLLKASVKPCPDTTREYERLISRRRDLCTQYKVFSASYRLYYKTVAIRDKNTIANIYAIATEKGFSPDFLITEIHKVWTTLEKLFEYNDDVIHTSAMSVLSVIYQSEFCPAELIAAAHLKFLPDALKNQCLELNLMHNPNMLFSMFDNYCPEFLVADIRTYLTELLGEFDYLRPRNIVHLFKIMLEKFKEKGLPAIAEWLEQKYSHKFHPMSGT